MIRGFFDPTLPGWPLPKVRLLILLPGITMQAAAVDFLLDTGASRTALHPADAIERLGIPRQQLSDPFRWPPPTYLSGVGGRAPYYPVAVEYGFPHTDRLFEVRAGQILMAPRRADNQQLVSLLGWDVLQHFEIILDWSRHEIRLTERY